MEKEEIKHPEIEISVYTFEDAEGCNCSLKKVPTKQPYVELGLEKWPKILLDKSLAAKLAFRLVEFAETGEIYNG